MELEERAKHLTMETNVWQSKARSYESMVTVLRSKLQQALLVHNQSREQSKLEGCGDSETDDAASVYIDNNAEAQQTRAMMMMKKGMMGGDLLRNSSSSSSARCCRKCRMKEASLLVLPCLHLCLCNECNASTDRCPVCNSVKTAYVEVYLC
jgi:E3 ubiquitin-protein ligase BOI-like protein